jgi:hypothetical protein
VPKDVFNTEQPYLSIFSTRAESYSVDIIFSFTSHLERYDIHEVNLMAKRILRLFLVGKNALLF